MIAKTTKNRKKYIIITDVNKTKFLIRQNFLNKHPTQISVAGKSKP